MGPQDEHILLTNVLLCICRYCFLCLLLSFSSETVCCCATVTHSTILTMPIDLLARLHGFSIFTHRKYPSYTFYAATLNYHHIEDLLDVVLLAGNIQRTNRSLTSQLKILTSAQYWQCRSVLQ